LRSERLRSTRSAARRPHSPLAARSFQHRIVLLLTAALLFTTATLAGSGRLVAQVPTPTVFPSPSATPTPGLTNVGTNYFVDNDIGNDAFNCLSPTILPQPVSSQVTGPCKTIQHAVDLTRDRDLVVVASQEAIALQAAIEVPDLIGVIATGFEPTDCQNVVGGFSKVVLQSAYGGPVFHVTAAGALTLHALIAGFFLGGTTDFNNPGAIVLDNDEFTEIRCDIVGQEDLPNVIGILTRGSEHPWIHDNTIHGSTQYPISVTLTPTSPIGGFGLVTDECLGGNGRTDQLQVERNLFAFNSNAGIWICSDGSGGHLLLQNNVRSNGRGIVLLSAVDTTIKQNAIGDNYYDGIDILDASQNNLLDGNQIESQEGPSSTGVLLQSSGDLFPLGNSFSANEIRRNKVDVLISGARATRFVGNSISAIGERTAILFAIGSTTGQGNANFGQPTGTIFRTNKLYDDGECTALRGCAIRLLPGVTTSIDATSNDFGVTDAADIQSAIWDHARDPELGIVLFSGPLGAPALLPTATAAPARVNAPRVLAGNESPVQAAAAPAFGGIAATSQPSVVVASAINATPAATPRSAASTGGPVPVSYIDPGSGAYYVSLTLCVTDANNQPVPGDTLMVSFLDGTGGPLGTAHALTDNQGCFSGDVQPPGSGGNVQPATVVVSDGSGGTTTLTVILGAPLVRPPRNDLPTP
jgi:parallel beta-helix repeat protein